MSSTTYVKYEFLRIFRNRMAFFFTLGFPLILFLVIGLSNKKQSWDLTGGHTINGALYYMVAMAGYGSLIGALSIGARIAAERQVGWNRQLRLTPLSSAQYLGAKFVATYAMCIASIVALFVVGAIAGVHVDSAAHLFEMLGLILIGLLPFIGIGVGVGHLVNTDAMGPIMGGGGALFAMLGGIWFPLGDGFLNTIGEYTPAYWIAQAARVGIGLPGWGAKGWLVILVWTLAAARFAMWAYRRDTQRA